MSLLDAFTSKVGQLAKLVNTVEEKIKRLEEDVRDLRKDNSELRREVAKLTERVSVLEAGRQTTAAEVKLAVEGAINRLDLAWVKEDTKRQIADALKAADKPS